MGQHNPVIRDTAIPYYANVWGYNRSVDSDNAIANTTATMGDLSPFVPSTGAPAAINAIRVLQPHYGNIIEASLNLAFQLAAAEPARQLRLAIGNFSSRYTAQTSYTNDYINASHLLITGRSTPYSIAAAGSFSQNKLNLYPAMYKKGNANFLEDAFVLLLVFDSAPSTGSGWAFTKFEVNCTMQMGLK